MYCTARYTCTSSRQGRLLAFYCLKELHCSKKTKSAKMAAAASGLLAQTPIGNNKHFLQIIPGQLSIVQFKAPFQLNPDYILNLQCHHITTLFKFLPVMLEVKPNERICQELILEDITVLINLCPIPNTNRHILSITRKLPENCTEITKKNIEEGELITTVVPFYKLILRSSILILGASPIQQSGLFGLLKEIFSFKDFLSSFVRWLELCPKEKQIILTRVLSEEEDQIALDLFLIINHSHLKVWFEAYFMLHCWLEND